VCLIYGLLLRLIAEKKDENGNEGNDKLTNSKSEKSIDFCLLYIELQGFG